MVVRGRDAVEVALGRVLRFRARRLAFAYRGIYIASYAKVFAPAAAAATAVQAAG